jgi:hypothetical protein
MNNLDLLSILRYYFSVQEEAFPVNSNHKGLPIMKLAIRIFALAVVFVGAAASFSSSPKHVVASHQSATASFPMPACGPGICPPGNGGN